MLEMPYAISILTALLAAGLGALYGRALFRRGFLLTGHVRVRDCPLIPVCLLLFVAVHIVTSTVTGDPTIGWALPVTLEYYLPGILWVFKTAFAAFGLIAIATVGLLEHHRFRIPLLLFAIVALCIMDGLTRISVQPYVGEIKNKVEDGVVLQTTASTCAAASAANIARRFGKQVNEADMVKALNTTWAGTSPAQLVFGFHRLGLEARKVYIPDRDLSKIEAPAVLLVIFGGEPDAHAVAYMGRTAGGYEIWDPNSGRHVVTGEDAAQNWGGRAIEVSSPAT